MASYGGPEGGNYYHPQQQMPIHQHQQYNQPRRGATSEVVYYDYDYATSNNPSQQPQPRQPVQENHQLNNPHYQPGFGYNPNQPPPNFQHGQAPSHPQVYHPGPEYHHASDSSDPPQGMYHVQAPPPSMERGYHLPMAPPPPRVAPAEYNDHTNNEKTGRGTYETYLSADSGPRIQKTILNDQQQERPPEFVNNSNYKPPSTSGNYNSGGLMDNRTEPRMPNSQESTYYNRPVSDNARYTLEARPDARPPSTQQAGNAMYYKSSSGTNNFNSETRMEPRTPNARPEDVYYNNKIGHKQDYSAEVSANHKNYTEPVPGIMRGGEPGGLHHKEDNKMKIFMGIVTQIQDSFGMIGDDVFFQKSCVKGPCPKLGDRVLVEAEAVEAMPFKWNSKRVQIVNKDLEINNHGSIQNPKEGAFTRREDTMQKSAPPPPSISNVSGILKHSQSLPSVGQLKSILKTSNSMTRNPPPPPVISKNSSTRNYHGKSIPNTEKYRPDTPEPVDFRSKPFFNEPSVFIQKSDPVSSRGTVIDYSNSGFGAYQSFSHNATVGINPPPLTGRVQDPFTSTMMSTNNSGPYHQEILQNNIPYRRISSEMIQNTKAPPVNRRSVSPFSRRQSRSPLPRRHSRSPVSRRRSKSPLSRRRSKSPLSRRRSKSPLSRRRSKSPLSRRRSISPLSRRRSKSPLSRRRSKSPLSRRHSRSPLARRRSRSPLTRRRSRSPLPRRRSRSPLPRRRSRSPLPKRRSRSPLSRRRSKSQSPNSADRKSEGMKRIAPPEKRIAPPEKRIAPPETRLAPPEGDLHKSSTSSKKLEPKVSSVDSSKYEASKNNSPYLPNPVYNNKSSLSSIPTVLPNPLHTNTINTTNRSVVIVSETSSGATNSRATSTQPPPPGTDNKSLKSNPVNEVIKQQMVVNPMKKIDVSASAPLTHTTPNVPGKSITTPVVNFTASTMSGNASKQKAKTKAEQAPAYVVKYEKPETPVGTTSKTPGNVKKPLIDTKELSASVDKALSELRKKFEIDKSSTTSKKENENAKQNVKVDAVTPKEKKVLTKSLPEIEIIESDSDNNEDAVDPQHKKFLEEELRLVQKEDWDAVDQLREEEDQRLRMKEEYRLRDLRSQESKLIRSGAPKEEIDKFRKANGTFEKRWAEEQRLIKIREEEENRKRDFEPRIKEEDSTRWQRRLMVEKEKEKRREEYRQRMRLQKENPERTRERHSSPIKSTRPPIQHRSRRSRSRSLVFRHRRSRSGSPHRSRRSRSGSPHRSRGSRSGSGHRHRKTSRSRERSPFFQDRPRRVSESPPRHRGQRSRRVSYEDYRRSRMNRSSRSLSRELEYEEFVERQVYIVNNDRAEEEYRGEEDEEVALARAMEMVRRKQQELDMREREIDARTSSMITVSSHEARVHNYDKGYRDHPKDDRVRRY